MNDNVYVCYSFSLNISISIQIALSVHYLFIIKKGSLSCWVCVWICEKHSAIHMLYNTMGMDIELVIVV